MKRLKKLILLVGLTIATAMPVLAADYVFEYDGGYLYVTNTGAVGYTEEFSASCVWTCVSNTSDLTAATLGTTSRYLYTEVNGNRYWLVGSTTNGNAVSVTTTAPETAYWRNSGDNLYYYSNNNYYLYYRGSSWRTSNSTSQNNNNAYYAQTNWRGNIQTDYRSTTTAGDAAAQQVTGYTVTNVTITPSAAQTVEYNGSLSYTAAATATQTVIPAHTTFSIGDWWTTTYHFYNGQLSTNADDFAEDEPATPTFTYAWALSGDGASALELMATSGPNTIVNYKHSASGTTATLTVTATAGSSSRNASVTINVTPVEPTAISATGTTFYMSGNGTVAYTLNPDYAYHRVNVASSNTSVFTVTSPATTGAVDIIPVAPGEATLTLTALNSDGSNGPSTSVTVTVRDICAAPQFSFEQSGSTVVATITTATPGATIYYTTDGTDPTPTTGTMYTGPFTVADGTNIKAIAVKGEYYDASAVAAKVVRPMDYVEQGVSGDIVTLNDLEDHTWSYYSDADCPIRSLGPADVKITYYGNGENTVSTTNGTNPATDSWTEDATGVKVNVGGEDENTFVYHKTLERYNGTTTDSYEYGSTAIYGYTTIPNPFQVRPTYGTGDTRWRGFYKWRIKSISNGHIYTTSTKTGEKTAYTSGNYDESNMLDAEVTYYFVPDGEYNMEVELEAMWARAYVVESNTTTGLNNGVSYERNFVYLSSNTTLRNAALSYPVTYTTVDPATGEGTKRTITIREGFTCGANTKFENVVFAQYNNNNQTMTANNHDLIIGRGCTGTINYVRGIGGNVTSPNYTIRLESGTINYLSFLRGYSTGGNNSTDADGSVGGTPNIKGVLGCDYDRATNSGITDNLIISNGAFYGYSVSEGSGITYSDNSFTAHVKSGKIGNNFTIDGSSYTATAAQAFYIGIAGERVRGHRKIYVEGGQLASIAGGIDATQNANNNSVTIRIKGGHVRGSVYGGAARSAAYGNRNIIVTGGQVTGWLGGGCNGEAYPAGQNDEDTYGGITNGLTKVYFGGTGICGGTGSNVNINGSQGGIVFGAGKGVEGNTTSGRMSQGTTVVVADECDIERNVYGGGNFGYAQTSTDVYISGGTVHGSVFGGSNQNNGPTINIKMIGGLIEGGLYGGSNTSGNITNDVTMHIDGGQVGTTTQSANIHGGGYGSATRVLGSVNLTLGIEDCDTVVDGVTVYGDVYGGSAEGRTNGNNGLTTGAVTNVNLYHGTIYGALYGGGLGSNSNPAYVYGPVAVKVYGGSVRTNDGSGENGSGGVFGCNNVNGTPQSTVTVDIYGTDPAPDANSFALFAVYGGGNRSHYTADVPVVTIHGCNNSIEYVYGGGNASNVPGTNVTIWGGHIGNAFGGGNGYSVTGNHGNSSAEHYNPGANITASGANLTIHGGTIDAAFGGSNQWGYINGGITVNVTEQDEPGSNPCSGAAYGSCSNIIVELYGGGNEAPAQGSDNSWISPSVTISSCDMKITNLFGGAKNANHGTDINLVVDKGQFQNVFGGNNLGGTISGNVTLTLNGGTMLNAFGGNNQGGDITGTITVTVDDAKDPDCPLRVDNVYGGGNQAAYTPTDPTAATPTVNFVDGTVNNAVFGGGLGDAAKITANPTVNVGGTGTDKAIVGAEKINGGQGDGNVYGGGSQADVLKDGAGTGNTSVTLSGNVEVKGNVYGGGNEAAVEGDTDVKLQ